VADCLGGGEITARLGANDDGGGGLLARTAEGAAVGQHDVDAGGLDALHALDGAGDLAFERADPGHLLHEGGEAHGAELIEQLVAGVGARGQALFSEQHAGLRGLADRHQDGGALGADVEGDAGFVEGRADAGDVLGIETGVERLEVRAAQQVASEADRAEHGEADQPQDREAARTKGHDAGPQPLQLLPIDHGLPRQENEFR